MDIIRWILVTPDLSHDPGKDLPYMGIIRRILVTPDTLIVGSYLAFAI